MIIVFDQRESPVKMDHTGAMHGPEPYVRTWDLKVTRKGKYSPAREGNSRLDADRLRRRTKERKVTWYQNEKK